jgi:hypothetical protein
LGNVATVGTWVFLSFRHSGEGRNPVFETTPLATTWMPVFTGMTDLRIDSLIPLKSFKRF